MRPCRIRTPRGVSCFRESNELPPKLHDDGMRRRFLGEVSAHPLHNSAPNSDPDGTGCCIPECGKARFSAGRAHCSPVWWRCATDRGSGCGGGGRCARRTNGKSQKQTHTRMRGARKILRERSGYGNELLSRRFFARGTTSLHDARLSATPSPPPQQLQNVDID